jgi:hypothetical protein
VKRTLLDLTQSILASLNSDEVNSIGDTAESLQVAEILRTVYYNMVARNDLPIHDELFQLTSSADPTQPVIMYRPDHIEKITWIKYFNSNVADGSTQDDQFGAFSHNLNTDIVAQPLWTTASTTSNTIGLGSKTFTATVIPSNIVKAGQNVAINSGTNFMYGTVTSYSGTTLIVNITNVTGSGTFGAWIINGGVGINAAPGYQYVTILPVQQFVDYVNGFNPTDNDVQQFNFTPTATEADQSFTFYYKTDITPQFCTILQNYYVIFDSYDQTQDSTLQTNKTMCLGQAIPSWQAVDTFIPALDDQQFPLLLNEAKSLAFYEIKQIPHPKADQEVKRQWSSVQKNKAVNTQPSYFDALPDFGRRAWSGSAGEWFHTFRQKNSRFL